MAPGDPDLPIDDLLEPTPDHDPHGLLGSIHDPLHDHFTASSDLPFDGGVGDDPIGLLDTAGADLLEGPSDDSDYNGWADHLE